MYLDSPTRHALSLNALRAFEASARLGGFARAAFELKVIPRATAALPMWAGVIGRCGAVR